MSDVMAQSAVEAATYADLEAVPPHLVAEIINGRLVTGLPWPFEQPTNKA